MAKSGMELFKKQEAEQATLMNALSPFPRSFPPEILDTAIEFLLLDEPPSAWTSKDDNPYLQTTTIRLVCRTWNSLVLSRPVFWTRLFFKLEAHEEKWLEPQTRNGKLRMSRCGDHGLQLYISGDVTMVDWGEQSVKSFISFIKQSSDRWTSLNIWGSSYASFFALILADSNGVRTQWGSLHTLNVADSSLIEEDDLILPSSCFPLLQAIELNLGWSDAVLSYNLPWSQLTQLSFQGRTDELDEHLTTLSQCINLESLTLTSEEHHEIDSTPGDKVVVPSLRSFKLIAADCSQSLLTNVLPRLILPRLQSLEFVERFSSGSDTPLHALCQIVDGSRCELQDLQVRLLERGSPHQERALGALLQRTRHTLRTLVVEGVGLTGKFLEDFKPERLEDFIFQESLLDAEPDSSLARWLRNQMQKEDWNGRCGMKVKATFGSKGRSLLG